MIRGPGGAFSPRERYAAGETDSGRQAGLKEVLDPLGAGGLLPNRHEEARNCRAEAAPAPRERGVNEIVDHANILEYS